MDKKLILWCSPGFGVVDIWLPVVKKLKKKGIKIDLAFPEPSSLKLIDKKSDLFKLADMFADEIIYKGYSGRWFSADKLIEVNPNMKYGKINEKVSLFAVRLFKGNASKYFLLKRIGEYIWSITRYVIRIKEDLGSSKLYNLDLLKNADGVMCDITTEKKFANDVLRGVLKNTLKFSMFHGLGATWYMKSFSCTEQANKRLDVIVYNMSHLEVDGYKRCFGIPEKNIIHAGIPRHDSDWIEFIRNQQGLEKKQVFESYIFIIGRPASPHNTVERKRKALKDIYDVICVKHKLKLIIKPHPKESLEGIDGQIYKEMLGSHNYGKEWVYSDKHLFLLGMDAYFSISFYSGVSIDMLSLNKPTIEYHDISGLDRYDNNESLRDENGSAVFPERYAKLVLGASNRVEFEKHVESIINRYDSTVSALRIKYDNYYLPFNESSTMVSNHIYNKISG
jgi:hypothetical protein